MLPDKNCKRDNLLMSIRIFREKVQIPRLAGFLFGLFLSAVIALPVNITTISPAQADAGIMRWATISTPGSVAQRFDIVSPGDIIDYAVGNAGKVVAVVREPATTLLGAQNILYYSNDYGIHWSDSAYNVLSEFLGDNETFNVAIARDNPSVWAITVGYSTDVPSYGPRHVLYTDDAGVDWVDTGIVLPASETIRDIAISVDYGGNRDIGVATVTGTGNGSFYIITSKPFGQMSGLWQDQGAAPSVAPLPRGSADYFNIRFSPNYASDHSVALVYATINATYFNVGFRDVNVNSTLNYAFTGNGVEVKNSPSAANASPGMNQLNISDLELPEDFSGQTANLRRVYISLDCEGNKGAMSQDGIFRIDDTHTYLLMDTSRTLDKSIYSIAYYGTYASGKLIAGERRGAACTATVPTWFTDSPTVCPIPCWYPALKPATGAAGQLICTSQTLGIGSARVAWSDDGALAFAGTGSLAERNSVQGGANWYDNLLNAPIQNDESAFSVSRNNGETWNQLGLIDTTIDWFNDVAPSLDCTTIYIASVNHNNGAGCDEFDSVWRSTLNADVADPLPASRTLGFYWERVMTHTTSISCADGQTDMPLLRLPQICDDVPDGRIVAWAAQETRAQLWSPDYGDFWAAILPRDAIQDFTFETSEIIYELSPTGMVQRVTNSGTEWNTKSTSNDSRVMSAHTIAAFPKGKVLVGAASQQADIASFSPVEGKQWITVPGNNTSFGNVHVAFDPDFANNKFVYLADDQLDDQGNRNTSLTGTVFREQAPAYINLADVDMMSRGNSAHATVNWPAPLDSPPHPVGQFGIVVAKTGDPEPAVYSAHARIRTSLATATAPTATPLTVVDIATTNITGAQTGGGTASLANNVTALGTVTSRAGILGSTAVWKPHDSAVCRTIRPWQAMPKFGITWDCLDIFTPASQDNVTFTLEPSSLKYCGCCTLDSYTTLFAIDDMSGVIGGYSPDDNQGMLWAYTDCIAKKGPVILTPEDGAFVGCDPVSGRNQQVDLSWEQLCLAVRYELEIYKDRELTMKVNPAMTNPGGLPIITAVTGSLVIDLDANNMTQPATWISPGALPEAGADYFWRVRVIRSSTGQIAISPWSAIRSFAVKPGFITKTPVQGIELLSPKDGCAGCPVKPVSLSWTPYKEATKYEVVLAKDAEMTQVIKRATTTTTAYEYKDALEYGKNYFWRVRSLEIKGQSNTSDWSGTFTFKTMPEPPPASDNTTKKQKTQSDSPGFVWVVILVIAAVPVAMLILIRKTRGS
jgi:hypothetical protein